MKKKHNSSLRYYDYGL